MTLGAVFKNRPTRSGAPMRLRATGRGLVVSLMLASECFFLSSCVGHEEKLPSGHTVRILRLYKDEGIAATIPEAYGSALLVSYCVTGAARQLSTRLRRSHCSDAGAPAAPRTCTIATSAAMMNGTEFYLVSPTIRGRDRSILLHYRRSPVTDIEWPLKHGLVLPCDISDCFRS